MTYKRQAGKKDTCHADVERWFRSCNWDWQDLHGVGGGCPDAMAAWRDDVVLVECKMPGETLSNGQLDFWRMWPSRKVVVYPKCTEARRNDLTHALTDSWAKRFWVLVGEYEVIRFCQAVMEGRR